MAIDKAMLKVDLRELRNIIFEKAREFELRFGRPEYNEYNFRNKIEEILKEYAWKPLGISSSEQEYKVEFFDNFVTKHYGRIDAYYGLVFFEYKLPKPGLSSESVRSNAVNVRNISRGF